MDGLAAVGIGLLALSVLAVCWAVVTDRVARRRLTAMGELLQGGRHDEVLAHPRLFGPYDRVADRLRSTSALLTGRFDRTLELLDGPTTAADASMAGADLTGRAGALLGMGRYAEAAALLGDDPTEPQPRHLRAQVALETGDDETARRLLATPDGDAQDEAGRQRILGDLLIRRGAHDEGEALVRGALAAYHASHAPACQVDAGYCHVHLAESAIAQRRADTALAHLQTAQALLGARPDNAPGFALLHLRRAEALALTGDAAAAAAALEAATSRLSGVPSRSLAAALQHARGIVASHLGDRQRAGRELRLAQLMHAALGEVPAAQEAAALLAELGHGE